MKFSHSYSEADENRDPCSSEANSFRNNNVVPSFQPMSSQQLKLSQGTNSGEIVESEYSGHVEMAKESEAKKKKYCNTYSRSEIHKLLNEPDVILE